MYRVEKNILPELNYVVDDQNKIYVDKLLTDKEKNQTL